MPPIILFKPLQATLTHNTEYIGKMSPYCTFVIGRQKIKGQPCKSGGKNPTWSDVIPIPFDDHPTCLVQIKHKDMIRDPIIGSFEIDLHAIEAEGNSRKWYTLFYKERPAGEILIEAIYNINSPIPNLRDVNHLMTRKSMPNSPATQDDSPNSNHGGLRRPFTMTPNQLSQLGSVEILSTRLPQNNGSSSSRQGGYAHETVMRGVGVLQADSHDAPYIRSLSFTQ